MKAHRPRLRRLMRLSTVALSAVISLALAGCGASKPAYCGNVTKLKSSISSINVSGGVSGLKSQLAQIADDAKQVQSSAKSDFPDQTSALQTSIAKLKTDIAQISSSPSPAQLANLASGIKAAANSVGDLSSATKSKCQ